MNKRTKGAIAAGGAAVLLLGGAGSIAYWSDEETLEGGPITSGTLGISTASGQWFDISPTPGPGAAGAAISDPEAFRIVPGDILEYRASATVTATGEHLVATLRANAQQVTGDAELLSRLAVTVTAGALTGENGVQITPTGATQSFPVTVRIAFDSQTPDQVGQGQTVNLDALTLTLQQNARS